MGKKPKLSGQGGPPLKAAAEVRVAGVAGQLPPAPAHAELLHELRVYQIELEMQNEALRKTQTELEASRDRYVDLYDFAPVGYLALTPAGRISKINLTGATLLGVERTKLLSRRFADFVASASRDRWHGMLLQTLRPLQQSADELLLQRGDGSSFPARIDCRQAEADGGGRELRLTLTDISDRALLKQSEERFGAIFELSPVGIGIAGADRRYRRVNPALCRMLGYSESDLLGMRYTDITHPDDVELNMDQIKALANGHAGCFSIEKRYVRKDGGIIWVSLNVVAVRGADDAGDYTVGLAEDITARRLAESQRLDFARQQRDTLVREVHHRIKNNLQSVAGLLQRELGRFAELDPRLATAIAQVKAVAVVHGLQGVDAREAIDLCDSVKTICDTAADLSQRPLQFHVEREQTGFRPVRVDSSEAVSVALVINELVLNAVKHSPAAGVAPPAVAFSADGVSAQVVIRNAVTQAPCFSIETGSGLGTGLRLVGSLLPLAGADLSYELEGGDTLVTRLRLTAPVVLKT